MTDKNYGVYLEFVQPRTVFFELKAASEAEARIITERQFKEQAGVKILEVYEIKNLPTYAPKDPSKLVLPNTAPKQ
jgi:hypothetical protein